MIFNFIEKIGQYTVANFSRLGDASRFAFKGLIHSFIPPFYPKLVFKQILHIGYFSLPVVGLTAIF